MGSFHSSRLLVLRKDQEDTCSSISWPGERGSWSWSIHLPLRPLSPPQSPPKARRQQMDLISELKRKQQKEPLIYESDRDGAIEDIITGEGLAGPVLSSVHLMLSSTPSTPP